MTQNVMITQRSKNISKIFCAIVSPRFKRVNFFQQRNMGNFRHYEGTLKDHDLRAFTFKGMRKNVAVS